MASRRSFEQKKKTNKNKNKTKKKKRKWKCRWTVFILTYGFWNKKYYLPSFTIEACMSGSRANRATRRSLMNRAWKGGITTTTSCRLPFPHQIHQARAVYPCGTVGHRLSKSQSPQSLRGRSREWVNTEFFREFKRGFVKCPLRELPLYFGPAVGLTTVWDLLSSLVGK